MALAGVRGGTSLAAHTRTPAPAPAQSKVLAERAAWDFQKKLPAEQRFLLSCVNPAFVFGPPLLKQSSASIDVR